MMTDVSPLADPRLEAVLARLYAADKRQFGAIVRHLLPRMLLSVFTGQTPSDVSSPADTAFLQDKLVAVDADKGRLAYTLCRALDARLVVEIGTSYGVSILFLAAALRDNARSSDGVTRKPRPGRLETSASGLYHRRFPSLFSTSRRSLPVYASRAR